jgi:hypothetical protein
MSWKARSARRRPLSRCRPRSRRLAPSGKASRTSAAVASESTICPAWANAVSRAQRYSGAPK